MILDDQFNNLVPVSPVAGIPKIIEVPFKFSPGPDAKAYV